MNIILIIATLLAIGALQGSLYFALISTVLLVAVFVCIAIFNRELRAKFIRDNYRPSTNPWEPEPITPFDAGVVLRGIVIGFVFAFLPVAIWLFLTSQFKADGSDGVSTDMRWAVSMAFVWFFGALGYFTSMPDKMA